MASGQKKGGGGGGSRGGGLHCAVTARNVPEDIPVEACRGWTEQCDYCDKRFGPWIEALDEEALLQVPQGPALFMAALRAGRGEVEVVDIVLDADDVSGPAARSLDRARDHVADRKSKSTKAVVLCRWSKIKKAEGRDVSGVCAHWCNVGVRPRFTKAWPGQDMIRRTEDFFFSDALQKWCHPRKEAFWRKPRPAPGKMVEVVEGCKWTSDCEFCDTNFCKWRRLEDAVRDECAPDAPGVFAVAVRCGTVTEVVEVAYDVHSTLFRSLRQQVELYSKTAQRVLRSKKFSNREAYFLVRWTELKDKESENACVLWAHFLNAGPVPMMNHKLPGEEILDRNKRFVQRLPDKKWCFEVEELRESRGGGKKSNRRTIAEELREDIRDFEETT